MNYLQITGTVWSRPFYAELTEGRVLRFTLKHIPKDEATLYNRPFTLFACEYLHPPPDWWHAPQLVKGVRVAIGGEVSLLNFNNKRTGLVDKTIKVTVHTLLLESPEDPGQWTTPRRRSQAGKPPTK